jgi:GDP-4-dehydro-6-deoxy-D-mannose reductase
MTENHPVPEVYITGINGFVGEHVAREFKNLGFSVIGIGQDKVAHQKVALLIEDYIECNLLNSKEVDDRLDMSDVKAVIHLAGLANVGESFDQPERYMTDNGIMTHNLLKRALNDKMSGRVVVISTGALYDPSQPLPLNEESQTNPNSPYAVGKLMAENVVSYYRSRGVDVVTVRPFNHIGPGQGPGFILPDFYNQLVAPESEGKMFVGNIETKRDYTDVRDVAKAYGKLALADSLQYPLYNVCSGRSLSGHELLTHLQNATGIANIDITVDPTKVRPTDIDDIVGDSSRLSKELDWHPKFDITQSVRDFVDSKK